jgi:hypothetical protein
LKDFNVHSNNKLPSNNKKQKVLVHTASPDIIGSITKVMINDSPLEKVTIDCMELLPKFLFSKTILSRRKYKNEAVVLPI